jgi:hypothetical protein
MWFGWAVLFLYYATVAGGRVYTGMHSTGESEPALAFADPPTVDIVGGTVLGIFCWALWEVAASTFEGWVETGTIWGE